MLKFQPMCHPYEVFLKDKHFISINTGFNEIEYILKRQMNVEKTRLKSPWSHFFYYEKKKMITTLNKNLPKMCSAKKRSQFFISKWFTLINF